jgi:hypothetical protein
MILGMTTSTFTLLHVLISLAGIGSGFIEIYSGTRYQIDNCTRSMQILLT